MIEPEPGVFIFLYLIYANEKSERILLFFLFSLMSSVCSMESVYNGAPVV